MQDSQSTKSVASPTGHASLWDALRCCLNPRVLIGLGAVALGIAFLKPTLLATAGPLLLYLICPLSMGLMMWMMMRGTGNQNAAANISNAEVLAMRARIAQLETDRPIALAAPEAEQTLLHEARDVIKVQSILHVDDL